MKGGLEVKTFLILAVVSATAAFAAPALASPPPNDFFANATQVDALPFTGEAATAEASTEFGEPQPCYWSPQTVWYAYTAPGDALLRADLAASDIPYTNLNVYHSAGGGIGSLGFVGCTGPYGNPMTFRAAAGATYYFQVESIFGWTGTTRLAVREIPPPANDDFASATPIDVLPFTDSGDTAAAGVEPGEPAPTCAWAAARSVWYAYRAPASGSVTANVGGTYASLAAYTGSSLASLSQVACRGYGGGILTFRAEADTTYYVQVGFQQYCCGTALSFSLRPAPDPIAAFWFSPPDPSIFDTVAFSGQSQDPGQATFVAERFEFGDGTRADGCCPATPWDTDATHRYAADGDYTVTDTVTTEDGRTASTTRTVHVQTHDVTITKLSVPQSASSGQTRSITVGITDTRYPETVRVELFASVTGTAGFAPVGSLTQSVPVRSENRTTPFAFSYTFTADDAAAGKVTFKAVATIVGARDALPADNAVVALPTKIEH
jgi:hypothetical protein